MEIHPGVFVSRLATEEWVPDPELAGRMHVLVKDDSQYVGLLRIDEPTPPQTWTLSVRQTVLVLEGGARVEIDGGPTLDLAAGDLFSLPAGTRATWHLTVAYRELWLNGRRAGSAAPTNLG